MKLLSIQIDSQDSMGAARSYIGNAVANNEGCIVGQSQKAVGHEEADGLLKD